jgi:hypothetical protein
VSDEFGDDGPGESDDGSPTDDGESSYELDSDQMESVSVEEMDAYLNDTVEDRLARGELEEHTVVDPSADLWAESVMDGQQYYEDSHRLWQAGDGVHGIDPSSPAEAVQSLFENVAAGLADFLSLSDDSDE